MVTALLALGAVTLTLLGVWYLPETPTHPLAPWLTLVGAMLGVYAFWRIERDWPPPEEPREERMRTQGPRRKLALALFWGGFAITGAALWIIWRQPFEWRQALIWGTGLILMAVGASQITGWRADRFDEPSPKPDAVYLGHKLGVARVQKNNANESRPARRPQRTGASLTARLNLIYFPKPKPWQEALMLLFIISVAIWFRLHLIHQMPPGVFIDETNAAMDALHTLEGRADSLFGTGWFETPNGFIYLQTLFFRLLGASFAAIKLQSILPGLFTVLALYFLAREMYGPYPALLTATFLAFNRWHVNMSRWGWNEVYPPLMQALSLFFIMRAARKRSLGDWAVGGLVLGLGMYTYLAIRMAALAVFIYLGYRALVEKDFLRRNWQGVALFILMYALTFAPLSFTYAQNPFTFLNRSQQVSILNDIRAADSLQPLAESVKRHLLMFNVTGDANPRHNLPGIPMLDPITGAFFLLGAAWSVWRWRDHRRGLVIIWVGVSLLGGILSRLGEAPQSYRTLAVAPAVALMAADAYNLTWRAALLPGRRYRFWRWGAALLMLAGLIAAGWLNYDVYFLQQARSADVYMAFTPLENEVARDVLARQDAEQLYLSPRLYYFSPVRFFTYRPTHPIGFDLGPIHYSPFDKLGGGLDDPGYHVAEPASDLPLPDTGQDAAFLLDLDYQYLMDYFHYFYPNASGEVVTDRLGAPLYFRVNIPAADIAAAVGRSYEGGGLRGRYYHGEDWQGQPFLTRIDPFLLFAWPEAEPTAGPFSASWTGDLLLPADGAYHFRLEADDGVRFWVDGSVAGESMTPDRPNAVETTLNLTAGPHPIRIDYFQRGGGKAMAFYWTRPGQPEQPVGPVYLRSAP
jgi:4-amino-4-deoxy-L-arabinose transferase-like glycosyltransferase